MSELNQLLLEFDYKIILMNMIFIYQKVILNAFNLINKWPRLGIKKY